MIQPHLIGDSQLLVGWDAGIMCLDLHHDGNSWSSDEAWISNKMKLGFNDCVIHKNIVYGLDDIKMWELLQPCDSGALDNNEFGSKPRVSSTCSTEQSRNQVMRPNRKSLSRGATITR